MPYQLLNILALGSRGMERTGKLCCVCSCICCYAQGFIASIATNNYVFLLQCKLSVCTGVRK